MKLSRPKFMSRPNRPLILPLTDDPDFIPCRRGDVLTEEQYRRAFPGIDVGLKLLAERFFADPRNQPTPQPEAHHVPA